MDEDEIYARQLQAEFEASDREANERDARIAQELQNQLNQEDGANIPVPPSALQTVASNPTIPPAPGQVSGSSTVNLSAGSAALIRLHHKKSGNFIKEVFKLITLSNNLVIFEIEAELESASSLAVMPLSGPKRLVITDDGKVAYGYDNTDRSKFKVEIAESGGNSGVYLMSWGHRLNRNVWGSVGWYLAMAPDGSLHGDSGKVEGSLWTLITASASLGVDIPRDVVIDAEREREIALISTTSCRPYAYVYQQPVAPRILVQNVGTTSTIVSPKTYKHTNPVLVYLASEDGQQYLSKSEILMEMYNSKGKNTHRLMCRSFREVLECLTYYKSECWEQAAIQFYQYVQRDSKYFPRPTPNFSTSSKDVTGSTGSSIYNALFGSSDNERKASNSVTTSNGYEMVENSDPETSTTLHCDGTTLFEHEYKKYFLSPDQVQEYMKCGYVLIPGGACTHIVSKQVANANPHSISAFTADMNKSVTSTALVHKATRLINYFNNYRMGHGAVHKSAGVGATSDSGSDVIEPLGNPYFHSMCCDPEILALYYDTIVYPITYQLLTASRPKYEMHFKNDNTASSRNGATTRNIDHNEIEMQAFGSAEYSNSHAVNNELNIHPVQYVDCVYISTKAPILPACSADNGPIDDQELHAASLINDWTEVNDLETTKATRYSILPVDEEFHTHMRDGKPHAGPGHCHKVVPAGRQIDTADTKHHGCRVIIALSDTTKKSMMSNAHKSLPNENSNGNMALYAKSHTGHDDVQLKQFYLQPGDVLICNQQLYCKELNNYVDSDIKLWVNMHVFHQLQYPNTC